MRIAVTFLAMISCTVAANLLLKTGASDSGATGLMSKITSWPIVLGLTCFGMAAFLYVLILTWLPLNVAQSFAAAQFIAVILAARIFLSEPINAANWLGIALIAGGITIVGWSR